MPLVVEPAAVFDAAAQRYDLDPHHAAVADQLVAGIQRSGAPALVIDVATGTGAAAFSALRRLEPGRVIAVDISPRMLDRARANQARQDTDGRIEWRAAPAAPLDVADGSADIVLCASSLHFLGRAAVVEWLRVLRPGGQVVVSLTIGDSCIFRFGNTENRGRPWRDVILESGDAFIFGGPSRFAFHSVPKTLLGTGDSETGLRSGRLNITLRESGLE